MSNARNIAQAGAELDNIQDLLTFSSVNQPFVYVRGYVTPGDGGGGHYSYINNDVSTGAFGTGSISGNTFYVVSTTNGTFENGQMLSGNGIPPRTYIDNKSSPGVFEVNISANIASTIVTGCNGGTSIVALDGSRWSLDRDDMPSATQFGAILNGVANNYYPLLNLYRSINSSIIPTSPSPLVDDILATNSAIVCASIYSDGTVSMTTGNTVMGNLTVQSLTLTGPVANAVIDSLTVSSLSLTGPVANAVIDSLTVSSLSLTGPVANAVIDSLTTNSLTANSLTVNSAMALEGLTLTGPMSTVYNSAAQFIQTWSFAQAFKMPITLGSTTQNTENHPRIVNASVANGTSGLWTVTANVSPTLPCNLTNISCVQVYNAGVNNGGGSILNASFMVPSLWYYEVDATAGSIVKAYSMLT